MKTLDKYDLKTMLHQLSLLRRSQDMMTELAPFLRPSTDNNKRLIDDVVSKLLDASLSDVSVETVDQEAT